ncbi:hypothetical protein CR513_36149, partial [Mucuna pruriens]
MVAGLPNFPIPMKVCEECYWKTTKTFVEKSKALIIFKNFKAMVKQEARCPIQVLLTDCGGEYTSHEFAKFCNTHDIKHQLTTT